MLCGADRGRYGNLVEELRKDFSKVNNDYPVYTANAYNLLIKYKTPHSNLATRLLDNSEEVLFTNVGGIKGKSNSYNIGVGRSESKM